MYGAHRVKAYREVVPLCPSWRLSSIWTSVGGREWPTLGRITGFPQSFQANSATVPEIKPWTLPYKSFPIHYSLTILSLDAIWASNNDLNKSQEICEFTSDAYQQICHQLFLPDCLH
jgi:hypothetical protein